jgi:transposase
MKHYVGLDVSLKLTAVCVVDHTGSVIREGVVDSDRDMIAEFVTSNAPSVVRIGLRLDRRPRGCGPSSSNLACQ